jgi:hypothetical protein
MESQNEHIPTLTDLLPKYRLVNALYRETVEKSVLSFDAQCRITDFYNEFNDAQAFEKAILNFFLSTDKEKLMLIISQLKAEIVRNIEIYTTHKDFFDGINTINVCAGRHNPLHFKIEEQLKDANKLWKELTEIRNSLESASWNNDQTAIERLTREEEKLDHSYKKEQKKIESLYQQQKESDNHATMYLKNIFGKVYLLECSFVSLLDSYFPDERKNTVESSELATFNPVSASLDDNDEKITNERPKIEPDMVFHSKMYEKFLSLEQKLIRDKYLNEDLHWIQVHENGKLDIKSLVIFLVGLLENNYFLPNKDPKIKSFFESRYDITIGQNFEKKRREALLGQYKVAFYNYNF